MLERFSTECRKTKTKVITTANDNQSQFHKETTSQPIKCKTKTNYDLVTRVFPPLKPATCICLEFSLAPSGIFVYSDWPLWVLWFWFYDTKYCRSKSTLTSIRKAVFRDILGLELFICFYFFQG